MFYRMVRILPSWTKIKMTLKSPFMKRIVALFKQEENYSVRGLILAFVAGCVAALACFHFLL